MVSGRASSCCVVGDDQVARQGELEAAAERIPGDRSDNGHLKVSHCGKGGTHQWSLRFQLGVAKTGTFLEIGADTKGALSAGGDDYHTDRRSSADLAARGRELSKHGAREGVHGFGAVEDELSHRAVRDEPHELGPVRPGQRFGHRIEQPEGGVGGRNCLLRITVSLPARVGRG